MTPRARAALGSVLFLVLVPGVVAGVVPWLLTRWDSGDPPLSLRLIGLLLIAAGVGALLHAFARFVFEGIGTPAPVAPTETLVVGGLYRHVRNPMYLAVAATIVGQALLLGRPVLLVYALGFLAVVAAFVHLYEEPTLLERYGERYEAYRRAVPGWRPRLRGWS
jgi:protein-S-isoprenylcysteine O-methyltransferase Ste14